MLLILLITVLLIFTGYYIYIKSSKKCTPSDAQRAAAGGDGVLTFAKDLSGNCVANTCNTVAGYNLKAGVCSMTPVPPPPPPPPPPSQQDKVSRWGDCVPTSTNQEGNCESPYLCLMSDKTRRVRGPRCLSPADCKYGAWTDNTIAEDKCNQN